MPKVIRFHEFGDANVLKLEDIPLDNPGEKEVRVNIRAIGLNRAEVAFRSGEYVYRPELPARLGYEGSGIVDAIGSGVKNIQIGDKVSILPAFLMGQYGVYGESAIIPAYAISHYPEKLTAEEAASIWMQYLTAYGAIVHDGNLQADQALLVTAASSSTGIAAIQIGKYLGAKVIASTRGSDKVNFLSDVGADHVIVSDNEDIAEKTLLYTDGKGADIIFDPVAGSFLQKMADAAAFGAAIYEYGALDNKETIYPLLTALSKALTIHGYTLYKLIRNPEDFEAGKKFVFDAVDSGKLTPIIDSQFDLKNMIQAHRYMESNKQKGKIIVTV